MEVCPKLETIDKPEIVLSEFMKVITRNYTKYHECANKVNAWQEWYKKQKDISDKANP
jgi:ferritin